MNKLNSPKEIKKKKMHIAFIMHSVLNIFFIKSVAGYRFICAKGNLSRVNIENAEN